MKKSVFTHPILFALSPVLSLYAHNIMRVHVSATIVPALATLAGGAVLFAGTFLLVRNSVKAAFVASLALVLCFTFGPVSTSITSWVLFGLALARPTVMVLVWAFLFGLGVFTILRTRRDLAPLTVIVNVIAIVLVVQPLWGIARYQITTDRAVVNVNCTYPADIEFTSVQASHTPDIYYIILDRYASNSSLRDYFDYDNTGFTDYLEQQGFYVAYESCSNYIMTSQSLASSLNLDYVDCLTEVMGENTQNRLPMFKMMKDYYVWRFLRARGYTFIHAGTMWHVTGINPYADINYNMAQMSEFTRRFVHASILFPVLHKISLLDNRNVEKWKRVRHNFDKLTGVSDMAGPTFVFGHFLVPHEPYVFDREGNFVDSEQAALHSREENYVEQLRYTNKRVRELIEAIVAGSATPPVIIIQADEGPYAVRTKALDFVWTDATQDELREKTRILNALYLPGADTSDFYSSISPVNSFRLVFNLYFGTDYEMLPDNCYAYVDLDHLYKFFDITDEVRW